MKKLLQNIFLASCLLLITGAVEAASAKVTQRSYKRILQQLEVDKVQYKNNPARYQEYERKIASIKAELRTMGVDELPTQTVTDEQPTETEQLVWYVRYLPMSMLSGKWSSCLIQ